LLKNVRAALLERGEAPRPDKRQQTLMIDGVYRLQNGEPAFDYVAPPTPEELARLRERIAKRVMGVLTRCDDVTEESGVLVLETGQGDEALAPLQAAASSYRIAWQFVEKRSGGCRARRKTARKRSLHGSK
jgi:hypothetical protein